MAENTQTEDKAPAAEAQQDVAQAIGAKAEDTGTASDELSEDDLEAVAGGRGSHRGGEAGRPEDRRHR